MSLAQIFVGITKECDEETDLEYDQSFDNNYHKFGREVLNLSFS